MTLSSFFGNFWKAHDHGKETPTEHVFKVDLPGLSKEEVLVEVENERTLSIRGQRKKEVQTTDTWHRVEQSDDQFMRKFRLPENARLNHITAKVENGVLTVVVPKEEKKRPRARNIEISDHNLGQQVAMEDKPAEQTAA